jgi:Caspase domain
LLKTSEIPLYLAWAQTLQQKVRDIARSGDQKQSPKVYSGLEGEFCLLGECKGQLDTPSINWKEVSSMTPCEVWSHLQDSKSESDLLKYIVKFLGSECVQLAERRLDTLTRSRSTLYVVSVGVDKPFDVNLRPLRYAASDASAVSEAIRTQIGRLYQDVQLYQLTNGTRLAILDAFNAVKLSAKPNDTLIIYLSGYASDINGRPYFIPADGKLGDQTSYVDLSEVQRAISGTFGRRILLIDSCGIDFTKSLKTVLLDDNRDDQVTILAAALPGQQAFEMPELAHGVFTYALLEGLSGKALPIGSSELTMSDLAHFVTKRVTEISHSQTPYFETDDPNPNFVLSRIEIRNIQ